MEKISGKHLTDTWAGIFKDFRITIVKPALYCIILTMGIGAFIAMPRPAQGNLAVTKEQFDLFLGSNRTGKIVYVNADDTRAYFVDFSEAEVSEKLLCDSSGIMEPLISPDGNFVTFATGHWSKHTCDNSSGTVWICRLELRAHPVAVAQGFDPHWWVDGEETYIVYRTTSCKCTYPCPGKTNKLKINLETLTSVGEPETLVNIGFGGGLSRNGRWLCTAYHTVCMYDLQEQKPYVLIDNTQACNPSITPSSDPAMQNRMIHLNLGIRVGEESYHAHETFGIRDNNDSLLWYIRKPEASGEWQHPEWSTHEDFATCCAGYGGNLSYNDCDYWDVYAIHIPSKATLRITQGGDYDVPHLWVGATSTTIERPSHSPKEFAGGEEKRNAYFHYGNGMINKEGTIRIHSRTNTLQDVTVVTPDGVTVFTHSSNSGLSSQTRCMLSSGVFLLRATTLSGRLFQQVLVVP